MNNKVPADDFLMTLMVMPIIVAVIFLHRFYPMSFGAAVCVGVPVGYILYRCLIPLTVRLLQTRYAPIVDERLVVHSTDSGCASILFIFFILMLYQIIFILAPQERERNVAKRKMQQRHLQTPIPK